MVVKCCYPQKGVSMMGKILDIKMRFHSPMNALSLQVGLEPYLIIPVCLGLHLRGSLNLFTVEVCLVNLIDQTYLEG